MLTACGCFSMPDVVSDVIAYAPAYFCHYSLPNGCSKGADFREATCKNRCLCAIVLYCEVNTVSVVFFLDDCNPIIFLLSQKTHSADGGNCSFLFSSSVWQGCGITSCQFVDTAMDSTVISWANDSLWKFHQNVWHCPEQCLSLKYIL